MIIFLNGKIIVLYKKHCKKKQFYFIKNYLNNKLIIIRYIPYFNVYLLKVYLYT